MPPPQRLTMLNDDARMRVIVTGGLGFIGSVTALRFNAAGNSVLVVDSVESNVVSAIDLRAVGIEVIEDSVANYLAACGTIEADLVVHAASPVGAAGVLRHPFGIAEHIVGATAAVGKACLAAGARLCHISSSEVYGLDGVLSERTSPRVPVEHSARVEYALGKLTSEAVLAGLARRGLKHSCLRPFNVVGARQSRFGGFVLPTFVQQALAGLPITVFSDGGQTRAFLDVEDLVDFIVAAASSQHAFQSACFNVGNPANSCSILELAQRTRVLLCSSSQIEFVDATEIYGPDYVEGASRHKLCHVERALALGWRPHRSLDEIIRAVAEHYRVRRDMRNSDARDNHALPARHSPAR